MKPSLVLGLLALVLLGTVHGQQPCELYIDPLGDDLNDGSPGSPMASLYQAFSQICNDGGTIRLNPGTYNGPDMYIPDWLQYNLTSDSLLKDNFVIEATDPAQPPTIAPPLFTGSNDRVFGYIRCATWTLRNLIFKPTGGQFDSTVSGYLVVSGGELLLENVVFDGFSLNDPLLYTYEDASICPTRSNSFPQLSMLEVIVRNSVSGSGATDLIRVDQSLGTEIRDSQFNDNVVQHSLIDTGTAGVGLDEGFVMTGVSFYNNTVTVSSEPLVSVYLMGFLVDDCYFNSNNARVAFFDTGSKLPPPFNTNIFGGTEFFGIHGTGLGVAVEFYNVEDLWLNECTFDGSASSASAGVESIVSAYDVDRFRVTDCTFLDLSCNTGSSGCALTYNGRVESIDVVDSNFWNNTKTTGSGSGLYVACDPSRVSPQFTVNIERCEFRDNVASHYGGGALLYCLSETGSAFVGETQFVSNRAEEGGHALEALLGQISVDHLTVTDNGPSLDGTSVGTVTLGAYDPGSSVDYLDASEEPKVTVGSSTFLRNSAGQGGALAFSADWSGSAGPHAGNYLVKDCAFEESTASNTGGAVVAAAWNGPLGLSFVNCSFTSNSAANSGGAVGHTGANSNALRLTIQGGSATDNTATLTGGFFAAESPDPGNFGNVFNITGMVFTNNRLLGGSFPRGGAVLFNSFTSVSIADCEFNYNIGGRGGALFFANAIPSATVAVSSTVFLENDSTSGSTLFGGAVAIYAETTAGGMMNTDVLFEFEDVSFVENWAGWRGGGVAANHVNEATVNFNRCLWTGNGAGEGAGVYLNELKAVDFNDCVFVDHNAATVLQVNNVNSTTVSGNSLVTGNTHTGGSHGAVVCDGHPAGGNTLVFASNVAVFNNTAGNGPGDNVICGTCCAADCSNTCSAVDPYSRCNPDLDDGQCECLAGSSSGSFGSCSSDGTAGPGWYVNPLTDGSEDSDESGDDSDDGVDVEDEEDEGDATSADGSASLFEAVSGVLPLAAVGLGGVIFGVLVSRRGGGKPVETTKAGSAASPNTMSTEGSSGSASLSTSSKGRRDSQETAASVMSLSSDGGGGGGGGGGGYVPTRRKHLKPEPAESIVGDGGGNARTRSGSRQRTNSRLRHNRGPRPARPSYTTAPVSTFMEGGADDLKSVGSSQAPNFDLISVGTTGTQASWSGKGQSDFSG